MEVGNIGTYYQTARCHFTRRQQLNLHSHYGQNLNNLMSRPAPSSDAVLQQRFSSAGPRPGTGPWHQLYRASRGSPGICHFSFLSNFHEQMFYSGNILRRKIFVNVSKNSDPDVGLRKLQYATRFH